MKRIEAIRKHSKFQEKLLEIEKLESSRLYCRHDWQHLLDVARVAYILNLESGDQIAKHILYATALLHDIGRAEEYHGILPHNEAGAKIAADILSDCEFNEQEIALITKAIQGHATDRAIKQSAGRSSECIGGEMGKEQQSLLIEYISKADKLTRPCYCCASVATCKWPPEKMNLQCMI